jgi:hypothetical protein
MSLAFLKIRLELVEGVPGGWQAATAKSSEVSDLRREAQAMKEVVGGKLRWLAIFEASTFS